MTKIHTNAYRMVAADPDFPEGWSPVGWDLRNVGGTGAIVARVRLGNPTNTGCTGDEAKAAGRLIDAAPDLLAALRVLLADAEDLHREVNERRENDGWDAFEEDPSFAQARAALAKAEGKDQS